VARQDSLPGLDRRLAALESGQADLSRTAEAARALAERAATRAEEAASRPPPAASAQSDAALNDLSARVDALAAQLREAAQAATGATETIERRLGEQQQQLAAATQPLERRLDELDRRLADATQPLERRLGELQQQLATATQPLEQRLGELEQRLAAATRPLEQRLAEQDQRLSALARQVEEGGSDVTRAGTRVVLADQLGDALREGKPYAEVLAALRGFTSDPAKLAPLDAFAKTGAPSAQALAQEFRPIAERLRREARQGSEDWTDRLLRMADKIVTVRAVNGPAPSGVPGTLATIEDGLARGAFDDAAKAWESLPEPARQASAAWGETLEKRAAAEAAARTVTADAVAALDQATR
jgi:hypothetical protein